ncbi:MAG: hypothetical protein K0R28_5 [Paenibacillus sp.]|jgi:hypothetical protein|nr:hypothetical protein [Paenibacillus sp.]
MLKRMLKKLLESKLGHKAQYSRYSSSDSRRGRGGYPPTNHSRDTYHNNQGSSYYRRKHKSHSSS